MQLAEIKNTTRLTESEDAITAALRKKLMKFANGHSAMGNQTMHGGNGSSEQKIAKQLLKQLDAGKTPADLMAQFKEFKAKHDRKFMAWSSKASGLASPPRALEDEGFEVDAWERLLSGVKRSLGNSSKKQLAETKQSTTTIYIGVHGVWEDDSKASAVYPVDVPSQDAQKIMDVMNSDDPGLDDHDNVDRFEQDGWDPQDSEDEYCHAHVIYIEGADLTDKSDQDAFKMKKNYYTMVYALRDLGLITQEYAKSIATT